MNHEIGEQCKRCGSSIDYEECDACGGEGGIYDYPSDNPGGLEAWYDCATCLGEARWPRCLSTSEWCSANPLPGREDVPSGIVETFVISRTQDGVAVEWEDTYAAADETRA